MAMRVLDRFDSSQTQRKSSETSSSNSQNRSNQRRSTQRETLSPSEIRARIRAHERARKEESSDAKLKVSNSLTRPNKEEVKEKAYEHVRELKEGEELEVESDIGKNDPNSEETQEKLRHVLRTGAFNFSDAERNVLSKILGKE